MKKEELFDIIGEVDEEKVENAWQSRLKKNNLNMTILKWTALAACLCFVIISVINIASRKQPITINLSNGDEIIFSTNGISLQNNIIDISIGSNRQLSESEAITLFGTTNVDASVIFEEGSNEFLMLDGTINGFDIEVYRKDIPPCIVIEGEENISYINGIAVTAGYFITDANSKGNRTAIVYGEFEVGNYKIHLETAGSDDELETLCNELAEEIFKLIENSSLDFEKIK